MYNIGDMLVILPPFGDGETAYEVTAKQGINEAGEIAETDIAFYQYELNECYFAEQFVEAYNGN